MSTLSQCVHGLDPLSQFRDRELVLLFLELIVALKTHDSRCDAFRVPRNRPERNQNHQICSELVLVILPITNQTNQNKPTKTNQPKQTNQNKPTKANQPKQTNQNKPTKPESQTNSPNFTLGILIQGQHSYASTTASSHAGVEVGYERFSSAKAKLLRFFLEA